MPTSDAASARLYSPTAADWDILVRSFGCRFGATSDSAKRALKAGCLETAGPRSTRKRGVVQQIVEFTRLAEAVDASPEFGSVRSGDAEFAHRLG
jgi:hypothetical protein